MKTITTTTEIDATVGEVWAVLTDFPGHAEWNPFFAQISGVPAVGETLKVVARKGDSTGMTFRPKVLVADGSTLRWLGKLGIRGIFDGAHEFTLSELPGGRTRLVHAEQFTGVLVPFLGKVLRDTHKGFEAFNVAIAERVAKVRQ